MKLCSEIFVESFQMSKLAEQGLRTTASEVSQNLKKNKTLRGENLLTIMYWWQKNNQFTLVHLLVAYGIFLFIAWLIQKNPLRDI
jgi:hypothetical protein